MCLTHQARRDKARQERGSKPHVGAVWHQLKLSGALAALQTRLLQRSRKSYWQEGWQAGRLAGW